VVVPESKGDRGWLGLALELRKILEVFQLSYGVVHKATRSGVSLGGEPPSSMFVHSLASRPRAPAKATLNRSYANVLVGQGLRLVNTFYFSNGFTTLEDTLPQDHNDNDCVIPRKRYRS